MTAALVAVVDDDPGICSGLSSLLRSAGYRCEQFGDATSFLVSTADRWPDCVLTDIQMPGLSGVELLEVVKTRRPGIPVIIMTAYPEEMVRARSIAKGAAGFLAKPFNAGAVLGCIADALESSDD